MKFRFLGSYDDLENGVFENSALFLSGGIHDYYLVEEIVSNKNNILIPNKIELFEIIKIAIQRKDIIGCITEDVNR